MELINSSLLTDPSLLAYYRAENNANDSSGNSHTATPSNISYVAGKYGQAFSLNGTNSQIDTGLSISNTDFSLVFWVKRGATGADNTLAGQGTSNATDQKFQIAFKSDNHILMQFFADDLTSANTYADTTSEHQLICQFNKTTKLQELYWDGSLIDSRTATGIPSLAGTLIYGQLSSSNWLNGSLDDLAIFTRVLTSVEIAALFRDSVAYTQTLTEAVSLSTVFAKLQNKVLTEVISFSDTFQRVWTAFKTFTETITHIDTFLHGFNRTTSFSEVLSMGDMIFRRLTRAIGDFVKKRMQ